MATCQVLAGAASAGGLYLTESPSSWLSHPLASSPLSHLGHTGVEVEAAGERDLLGALVKQRGDGRPKRASPPASVIPAVPSSLSPSRPSRTWHKEQSR